MFNLDERLASDTALIGDLPLCRVLLMNDQQFPWVILVPRRAGVRELFELEEHTQHQFLRESSAVCNALTLLFNPDKLNVAALGNVVAQLHVHHVARFSCDTAWPAPVWGRQAPIPYPPAQLQKRLTDLRDHLLKEQTL